MFLFFKKYHKWLGVFLALSILFFVISGIILNHRQFFSSIEINRKYLPKKYYQYNNWNNASVKTTLKLNNDSIFIYGDIGVWLTDSTFADFQDFNAGFPKGADNHKIYKLSETVDNKLLAGTLFGVFKYNFNENKWQNIELPVNEKRISDIIQKQDTTLILTRSHLLKTTDLNNFDVFELPKPINYDNKIGLFKTLWVIHSGEIYGEIGKLIVDFAGLFLAFLTITGFIIFVNRIILKKNKKTPQKKQKIISSTLWNIKWHNKIGWIIMALLIVNTTSGVFLRPPLLIPIANSRVKKIPYTKLAEPNPWYDLLRRIDYDEENNRYFISAMDGFYYSDNNFNSDLEKFKTQPPASVMGVTVLEKVDNDNYLIGSFEGLFLWNYKNGEIFDYIKQEPYVVPKKKSRPIGQFLVTGFSQDYHNQEIVFDYNQGAINISSDKKFVEMPREIIEESAVSLWNFALELHTGRLFQFLLGDFYILIVPLVGLSLLFILISGFWVWLKIYRKNS